MPRTVSVQSRVPANFNSICSSLLRTTEWILRSHVHRALWGTQHSEVLGIWTWTWEFRGDTIQPIMNVLINTEEYQRLTCWKHSLSLKYHRRDGLWTDRTYPPDLAVRERQLLAGDPPRTELGQWGYVAAPVFSINHLDDVAQELEAPMVPQTSGGWAPPRWPLFLGSQAWLVAGPPLAGQLSFFAGLPRTAVSHGVSL